MPVSIIVGGQYGSEGKGKVALDIARRKSASAVVRVGGSNSGHIGIGDDGKAYALRQIPAAALAQNTLIFIPSGSLIDVEILKAEIALLNIPVERLFISPYAMIISNEDKAVEVDMGIIDSIGSTGSGTGAALQRRISRQSDCVFARDIDDLRPYLGDTTKMMREILGQNGLIVVEGTQGFGLSLLHGGHYPKATSRDTTAGSFIGEAGLSPLDVSDITMVIRAFPIRVAGNSGPLPKETSWREIAQKSGLPEDYQEVTTATKKVRRVGEFDADVVKKAIEINKPSSIVLNHIDYIGKITEGSNYPSNAKAFVDQVEKSIGQSIDWFGVGPGVLLPRVVLENQKAA